MGRLGGAIDTSGLPKLMRTAGKAAGQRAIVLMHSGAQLDLVSSEFVAEHGLEPEGADVSVRLPKEAVVPVMGRHCQRCGCQHGVLHHSQGPACMRCHCQGNLMPYCVKAGMMRPTQRFPGAIN